ncbi:MAG: DMT family transporter [Clostridiales bacterium]|nr:DMT family transporter [Clostridiales bacterium]
MYDKIRKSVFPLFAALIWGVAFVAQTNNTAGAFTFNAMRAVIAFIFLIPVVLIFTKGDVKHLFCEKEKKNTKALWIGGVLCGVALSFATYLQQLGIDNGTEAGKASFLTAMYIVIVPIIGMFFKKKVPLTVWISAIIAVGGLYLLCIKSDFSVRPSDILVVACSFVFACHIMIIDKATSMCNGIKLSCIQFLTMAVVSSVCAFIFETPKLTDFTSNVLPILYLGVCSSGIAYTLQILAQKDANPTVTTLLLSMESVFGVIAGAIGNGEIMIAQEYIGCALMLVAVVLAQIPIEVLKKPFIKSKKEEYTEDKTSE